MPSPITNCWWNGQIVAIDEVRIPLNDRGFTLGDGLFETLLWTGASIRFFEDHMARLSHGAQALGIVIPFDVATIESGLLELAKQSMGVAGAMRLTLTRGVGARGLQMPIDASPFMLATLSPVESEYPAISLSCVDVVRPWGAPSSRFKTLSYVDHVVALSRAQALGAEDGLMRGQGNRIACATRANVIVRYQDRFLTPPVSDGALPGIIRGRLLGAGLIEEAEIDDQTLAHCTSACLTNSLIGVRRVYRLDERSLDGDEDWITHLAGFIETLEGPEGEKARHVGD
ncbi:aminotransferase class IV [Candidatus Phycosocius spiralis]|nr:aminotransferase class IV [Candidatus Phycosocius spiralis]